MEPKPRTRWDLPVRVLGDGLPLEAEDGKRSFNWIMDDVSAALVGASEELKADLNYRNDGMVPKGDEPEPPARVDSVSAIKTLYAKERHREAEYQSAYYHHAAQYSRERIAAMMEAEARGESYVDLLTPDDRRRKNKAPEN